MNIPNNWRLVTLGEVCEFKYGKSLSEVNRSGGDIPVFGSNGEVGKHDKALTTGPTIIIGRKGSYGEVNYSPVACWPIDTTYYIDATATQADLLWLMHRLSAIGLNQLNRAAAVPGLNREDAYRQKLLLPPRPEQRRIAAILDKADEIRVMRRVTLGKLDTLTQSIFLEMFGDPVTNPRKFPIAAMGDVCDVRDGTHDSPKYVSDGGFPLLTSKNVTGGTIDLSEVNYISEADYIQINKRSKVDLGDIILPMIGTIGSPVIVENEPCFAIKNVALIKFIEKSPAAVFVLHLLSSHYFDYIVGRKNRGGTQKFVSLGDLRDFPLPLPPRENQDEFCNRVETISRLRLVNNISGNLLNELFDCIQHRAFRGEL